MSSRYHTERSEGERRMITTATTHALDHTIRRQRQTTIVENRRHPVARDPCLDCQQRPQLPVAILLHDVTPLVRLNERAHARRKRKRADAHVVDREAVAAQP